MTNLLMKNVEMGAVPPAAEAVRRKKKNLEGKYFRIHSEHERAAAAEICDSNSSSSYMWRCGTIDPSRQSLIVRYW